VLGHGQGDGVASATIPCDAGLAPRSIRSDAAYRASARRKSAMTYALIRRAMRTLAKEEGRSGFLVLRGTNEKALTLGSLDLALIKVFGAR
jgi:hypothetical protein